MQEQAEATELTLLWIPRDPQVLVSLLLKAYPPQDLVIVHDLLCEQLNAMPDSLFTVN